ncbi:hypothetical protein GCM10009564_22340 [Streptomyces thermogriseus]|uniref:Uncharacterized protein n=1 Tax=Streptomyces thermogriseus TaxID=75292 RepID=A0ABN1SY31_9ACTN
MNYGRGVWGNAALNTVVMCPDLREQLEEQGAARSGRRGATTGPALLGAPAGYPAPSPGPTALPAGPAARPVPSYGGAGASGAFFRDESHIGLPRTAADCRGRPPGDGTPRDGRVGTACVKGMSV